MICRHEVSIVFHGPVGRAVEFSWDHHHSWSSGHMAHSTGYVVVLCSLKRRLILCSIHIGMSICPTSICEVLAVFCINRHAEMVSSTPFVSVGTPSSDARVDYFRSFYFWAGTLPPPCVYGPPTWWSLGAGRSSGSSRSGFPILPRGPIPPG